MTGFVLLDKPAEMTSFFAVAKCRRLFGEKKAGHTGTLDPMATGVLVVGLGTATRFIDLLPHDEKSYRASFRLGESTDTLDSTGRVLARADVRCGKADVEAALAHFRGEIWQVPPMYSALRQDGVRLYTLARQGVEVARQARSVTIHSLHLVAADEATHTYTIDVTCSAGTYIRSLIADLGEALGTLAVMTSLRRTAANGQSIAQCHTLEQLEALAQSDALHTALLRPEDVLAYDRLTVTAAQAKRFLNGGELDLVRLRDLSSDGYYCVFAPDGTFLGVGDAAREAGTLRVKKTLPHASCSITEGQKNETTNQ